MEKGKEKTEDLFKAQPKATLPAAASVVQPSPLPPEKGHEILAGASEAMSAAATSKVIAAAGISPVLVDPATAAVRGPEDLQEMELDVDTEEKMLAIVRKRQNNKQELIKIAISQTNAEDWILQGGKPYLEITGAEKIAPIFSVAIKGIRYEKEVGVIEADGKKYIRHWYFGQGVIAPNGRVLYSLDGLFGSSWTRDDFFGKTKDGWKECDEIDERDLRYKAYSDLMRVAVVRLLGLRSVSIEQLEKAGIKIGAMQSVDRGVTVTPEEKVMQDELFKILKDLVGTDPAKVKAKLKEITYFEKEENGKKTPMFKEDYTQLKGPWLIKTLNTVRSIRDSRDAEATKGGAK